MPSKLKKNYILDTCTAINSPNIIEELKEDNVIIPFEVLEEVDNLKSDKRTVRPEVSFGAREFVRSLEKYHTEGNLQKGIKFGKGLGTLSVVPSEKYTKGDEKNNDERILNCALWVKKNRKGECCLLTRDFNLRLIASSKGLSAMEWGVKKESIENGWREVFVDDELVDHAYQGILQFPKDLGLDKVEDLFVNAYLMVKSNRNPKKAFQARYNGENLHVTILPSFNKYDTIYSMPPKYIEQSYALNALLDDSIPLVTLSGVAGGGKTLFAVSVGLDKVLSEHKYKKILISRPIETVGRDLGYLPGSLNEKMAPWIEPIKDNLLFLLGGDQFAMEELFEEGIIEIQAIPYIRGRSITDTYIIIDEAQNLSEHELKTIITRVRENSKIVLTGDVRQIDNTRMTANKNGIKTVVEAFKPYKLSAHVTLDKSLRSDLAAIAAKIL